MRSYLMLALKVLTRRKFFTFISLFGISLTLVVLVVATAILDDMFSPSEPESRFDRALLIDRIQQYGPQATMTVNPGYGFLQDYVLNLPGIERASAFTTTSGGMIYTQAGRIDARIRRTDANYWKILDFRFLEGRPFTPDEETRGATVAVITDGLREKLFGSAPAMGRPIEISGQRFTVIGVVPDVPATRGAGYSEMWVPLTTAKSSDYRRAFTGNFCAVVLLRDRGDIRRVQADFAAIVPRIPVSEPKVFTGLRARLDTQYEAFAHDVLSGPGTEPLRESAPAAMAIILIIVAVLFMTLPALNLVTLNLSRILERAPEIGVRKAFGAPRRILIAQFVMENVVLTLVGGVIAFVLAFFAVMLVNRSGIIPHAQFAMNLRVFAYGMGAAAFFGVFSGAYPAWRMSRLDPVTALRGGAA